MPTGELYNLWQAIIREVPTKYLINELERRKAPISGVNRYEVVYLSSEAEVDLFGGGYRPQLVCIIEATSIDVALRQSAHLGEIVQVVKIND